MSNGTYERIKKISDTLPLNLMFQIFNPRLLSGIGCYSLWESWNAFVESKVESATSLLHPLFNISLLTPIL